MEIDTICAISTPLGQGGIGIIRISGEKALEIGRALFCPAKNIKEIKPYRLYHGYIKSDKNKVLDEVLVSYMPSPGSYTGEDVFEINCHGGPVVVKTVLEEVIKKGARLAKPGEFTLRAYLNNKIDLSKAEAIAEIISCRGDKALSLAANKLHGALKEKIDTLKQKLETIMAEVVALMDFDEEVEEIDMCSVEKDIHYILKEISHLIENYNRYSVVMEGAKVVLCGEVNAGKSSLLNAILGKERAIVTSYPGTTRDFIEEVINVKGIPVKIIDTAGIRKTKDEIEIIGVKKGIELIKEADIVVIVFDISVPLSEDIKEIISIKPKDKIIAAANKIDISEEKHKTKNIDFFIKEQIDVIKISAKTRKNIDELVNIIEKKIVGDGFEPSEDEIVPNLRQTQNLEMAKRELQEALNWLNENLDLGIIYTHLENTTRYLKEITGEITTEEVLNKVFSCFCIGK